MQDASQRVSASHIAYPKRRRKDRNYLPQQVAPRVRLPMRLFAYMFLYFLNFKFMLHGATDLAL